MRYVAVDRNACNDSQGSAKALGISVSFLFMYESDFGRNMVPRNKMYFVLQYVKTLREVTQRHREEYPEAAVLHVYSHRKIAAFLHHQPGVHGSNCLHEGMPSRTMHCTWPGSSGAEDEDMSPVLCAMLGRHVHLGAVPRPIGCSGLAPADWLALISRDYYCMLCI